ncbi:fimbrial protein [Serratia marcescens]|uniref:fimbrial protein n=1 Tax=Serratia marcescens TaxID=615 RepID=UPI0007C96E66|nr:fimbrial protein [Serratia marcescens]OAH32769.1 fimbrial protein [Serratia marcescens]
MRNTEREAARRLWLTEARYYATLGGVALMVPLTLGMMLWLLPAAQAEDWGVDGNTGRLWVSGALIESACRLEMTSVRQEVALGTTATGRLTRPGDTGTPVHVALRLTDCLHSPSNNLDRRIGTRSWAPNQPAVSVSFLAPADADNPQLVKVDGAQGLGLRLRDSQGEDVRLGDRGRPLRLTPGQDTLDYTITPERTAATLAPGAWRAVVDFHLSYD